MTGMPTTITRFALPALLAASLLGVPASSAETISEQDGYQRPRLRSLGVLDCRAKGCPQ
jgi:hypothetical protein